MRLRPCAQIIWTKHQSLLQHFHLRHGSPNQVYRVSRHFPSYQEQFVNNNTLNRYACRRWLHASSTKAKSSASGVETSSKQPSSKLKKYDDDEDEFGTHRQLDLQHKNSQEVDAVVVDEDPVKSKRKIFPRLPVVSSLPEFPQDDPDNYKSIQANWRILKKAATRLAEPPTLQLLVLSACTTLGIAATEGVLLCHDWPWQSMDASTFVFWYALENLTPSMVWGSQDPILIARSMELDPTTLLRELSGQDAESARVLLRTHWLATTRFFVAGFVMIASIVRAANISARALSEYEDRIKMGREPPFQLIGSGNAQGSNGMVIRMCGRDSATTEVSMARMKQHIFPVYEQPERVLSLVWKHSDHFRRPVYWCVREGKYGVSWSWDRFPADTSCFFHVENIARPSEASGDVKKAPERILVLEADATNPQDPLALKNSALDLNLDDASQGFRRIHDLFAKRHGRDTFRVLRVYLGNSMEIARSGAGHSYTLRHRIRYAKEVDVLIDSRAPVLVRILEWCRRVAGTDRRIFFQTSSRDYFVSLRKILRCYGYEVYDPLDLRARHPTHHKVATETRSADTTIFPEATLTNSFIGDGAIEWTWRDGGLFDMFGYTSVREEVPVDDRDRLDDEMPLGPIEEVGDSDMLRQVVKLAKLPRLVHLPTTAATVSAVEAMIRGGQVDAHHCCAILERQEGVNALEYTLQRKSEWVEGSKRHEWVQQREKYCSETDSEAEEKTGGRKKKSSLDIICTSSVYDDLFRQVRMWAKMGFTSAQIQKEMDRQFHEMLAFSHEARKEKALEEIDERDEDMESSDS